MKVREASALALTAALFLSACSGGEQAEETAAPSEATPAVAAAPAEATVPELTADGVWAHLTTDNDYESWALWPGKGEQYGGGAPHGAQLTTYLNEVAAEALAAGAGSMPVGAIIVKNNYMDGMLMAVTAMVKTEDFNPDHNDWWFLKRTADGSVDAAGRFDGCEGCHGAARANDYVLTGSLSAGQ